MRYLKIFEDFEDKLYSIVDPIGIADNRVAFNDYKLSKLSEECKKLGRKTYTNPKSDPTKITITGLFSTDYLDLLSFEDDWFMLIDLYAIPDSIYYKCDTIEGVIQCLKDNYTKS